MHYINVDVIQSAVPRWSWHPHNMDFVKATHQSIPELEDFIIPATEVEPEWPINDNVLTPAKLHVTVVEAHSYRHRIRILGATTSLYVDVISSIIQGDDLTPWDWWSDPRFMN